MISVILLYFLVFSVFWFWTYRTNLAHRKQEFEKDEKYKEELDSSEKGGSSQRGKNRVPTVL